MDVKTLAEAEKQLSKLDPKLGKIIKSQKLSVRPVAENYFAALARSIVGQQVSVAAASTIFGRLVEQTKLDPKKVALLDETTSKIIGLSRQKLSYLRDLAKHFAEDPAVYNHLESQTDEAVITELTAVKGIGIWTAQMFLMFTLRRPDVFAPDDVGLQRAMMNLYDWDALPPKAELEAIVQKWRPYRTIASFHLWQSLDNTPD